MPSFYLHPYSRNRARKPSCHHPFRFFGVELICPVFPNPDCHALKFEGLLGRENFFFQDFLEDLFGGRWTGSLSRLTPGQDFDHVAFLTGKPVHLDGRCVTERLPSGDIRAAVSFAAAFKAPG